MEYYSFMRKKEILPFSKTWINLEAIMLSELCEIMDFTLDGLYFFL